MPRPQYNHAHVALIVDEIMKAYMIHLSLAIHMLLKLLTQSRKRKSRSTPPLYSMICRMPNQAHHLSRLVSLSDANCISNLRMDRNTFGRLCKLLRESEGLVDGRYVCVEEQVAIFLGILAHHKKNRVVGFNFQWSGQTVSSCVHLVLKAILKLHSVFLVKPTPVEDSETDPRWKWFKGCLGALDGSYINVAVRNHDKPRYRNRKGQICSNTLAVCDRKLRFIYVLSGWEGSAADDRVLRDAVNRTNGLKVPIGSYYLCDNGYANSEGFLTPYKEVRYHLKEWGPDDQIPQNATELFNMRHTKARNVIERAFGVMKMRWGILRSASYYPIKMQIRLVMSCFLLHNFIRTEMPVDPIEQHMEEAMNGQNDDMDDEEDEAYVDHIEATNQWNQKRDELASDMWEAFVA